MSSVQNNPLALQIGSAKIAESEALALQSAFKLFLEQAEKWKARAESIQVTSVEDKAAMKEARDARLALKEIRCNVENKRKELKEESLRKGKAIDSVANFIKGVIEPLETHLQQQEDFAKIEEEKARAALREKRSAELVAIGVDPAFYDLSAMPEGDYARLLETSRESHRLKKEAEEKAEQERIAKERADAEERERQRIENERLRKEAEEREKVLAQERAAKQAAEAALRAKKEEEERQERERQEAARRAALAPDREKLEALAQAIASVPMPDVESSEAKAVIRTAIDMLTKASQFVKTKAVSL